MRRRQGTRHGKLHSAQGKSQSQVHPQEAQSQAGEGDGDEEEEEVRRGVGQIVNFYATVFRMLRKTG